MPLGLWMLLAVAILIGGMWLHNIRLELQLRRIARRLDIPGADLRTTDLVTLLSGVRSWAQMRYVNLYHRTNALTLQFCDTVGGIEAKHTRDQVQKVSGEDATEQNALQLESVLWLMGQDTRNHPGHAKRSREIAHQAHDLLCVLRELEGVRNRIPIQQQA